MLSNNIFSRFKKTSKILTIPFAIGIAAISTVSANTKLSQHTHPTARKFIDEIRANTTHISIYQDNKYLELTLLFGEESEGEYEISKEVISTASNDATHYISCNLFSLGEKGKFSIFEHENIIYFAMFQNDSIKYAKLFTCGPLDRLTTNNFISNLTHIAIDDYWLHTTHRCAININPLEDMDISDSEPVDLECQEELDPWKEEFEE